MQETNDCEVRDAKPFGELSETTKPMNRLVGTCRKLGDKCAGCRDLPR